MWKSKSRSLEKYVSWEKIVVYKCTIWSEVLKLCQNNDKIMQKSRNTFRHSPWCQCVYVCCRERERVRERVCVYVNVNKKQIGRAKTFKIEGIKMSIIDYS